MRRIMTLILAAVTLTTFAAPAFANNGISPGPAIFADGEQFRTKGAADLPAPTGNNAHSYDDIYVFEGATANGQLPVAEAAPGERDFNGGRWAVQIVEWNTTPYLLTSDDEVHAAMMAGDLVLKTANARYFECPLVPVN